MLNKNGVLLCNSSLEQGIDDVCFCLRLKHTGYLQMHVSFIHLVNCISYCLMLWNVALANDSKDRFFVRRKIHSFSIFGRNKKQK